MKGASARAPTTFPRRWVPRGETCPPCVPVILISPTGVTALSLGWGAPPLPPPAISAGTTYSVSRCTGRVTSSRRSFQLLPVHRYTIYADHAIDIGFGRLFFLTSCICFCLALQLHMKSIKKYFYLSRTDRIAMIYHNDLGKHLFL